MKKSPYCQEGNLTATTNAIKLFEQRVRGRQGELLLELQKLHFSGAQSLFDTSHAFITLHIFPDSSMRQFPHTQQIGTCTSTRVYLFAKMHSACNTRQRVCYDSEQCRERTRRQAKHRAHIIRMLHLHGCFVHEPQVELNVFRVVFFESTAGNSTRTACARGVWGNRGP